MAILDLQTISIQYIFSNFICMIVMFTLWKQNHSRYSGIEYWMVSFVCNFVGMPLLAARGYIPDFFSMLVGSVILASGTFLIYIGFEHFLRDRKVKPQGFIVLGIYVLLQAFFIYIQPSLTIRNILFSSVLALFSFQIAWLLLKKVDSETKKITTGLGIIACAFGMIACFRIISNFLAPAGSDLSKALGLEAVFYLSFQMLYIILTVALFTLVNRRLFIDLEHDTSERIKVEQALQISQEKYTKAFQASPNAILITRIKDGQIIEVNDVFQKVTGYSREETLTKTTLTLGFWVNPKDREIIVTEMQANSRVQDFQFDARTKSGKVLRAELSAEYIKILDDDCMLSNIRDISERHRMEDILHLQLELWDFSTSHTALEVMQKALDEIEELTGSKISFYHLVEEDKNSLTLQAWSTRTRNEFCKAESGGMHYSIDKAGVWVDCIKERKAVIHNDYASLPNRKGLPDGHATVVRELVVPILHEDQIVSILGIGNKTSDYDKQDVELVEYIGSLVWTIVSQKRADEKIQKLNGQLEKLAMTDELTGLPNRRQFFIRGMEEINRSRRYRPPLSMIMIDIDKFKNINDSYGHDMGDHALHCIAKTLGEQIREVDMPARLGGEEFGVLLPNTRLEDAVILAERIRKAIEDLHCLKEDETISLTASLGVAAFLREMKSLDELVHNADTAMYQAKALGRNRVVFFE